MKKYIQPQTQVVEISVRQLIAVSETLGVYGKVDDFNPASEKIEISESYGDDDW